MSKAKSVIIYKAKADPRTVDGEPRETQVIVGRDENER